MKTSIWYKSFGGKREERYYHITEQDEAGTVHGTEYRFDTFRQSLIEQRECSYETKWWMEQQVKNSIHEVAESSVPFLLGI